MILHVQCCAGSPLSIKSPRLAKRGAVFNQQVENTLGPSLCDGGSGAAIPVERKKKEPDTTVGMETPRKDQID